MEWAIIGTGRMGSALARWLRDAGAPPCAVVSHRALPAWLTRLPRKPPAGLLLAVPDDALPDLARQLARARSDWTDWHVIHTSGTCPASVLHPLARRSAHIATMHPMMTITRVPPSPRSVVFSLEGDAAACRAARTLVRRWHGHPLPLTPAAKAAYHLAATLTGPGTVVNFAAAEAVLAHARLSPQRLRTARAGLLQLLRATANNLEAGVGAAWTGPWSRHDRATIARQRQSVPSKTLQKHYDGLTAASTIIPSGRSKKQ